MIEASKLKKAFKAKGKTKKKVMANFDVSFVANDGCITGLLGANGAGKSTSLRMVAGLISPDSGSISIDGRSLESNKLEQKKNIGYMPHSSGLYPRSTVLENIEYFARLAGLSGSDLAVRIDELVDLLEMQDFCQRRAEGFSQGQQTKVALARSLIHRPKNIILDEPTNGLDVLATRSLRRILLNLKDQGHCILISSHVMQEVTLLCDSVAIINAGTVVVQNSVNGIMETTNATNFEDAFVAAIQPGFRVS